MSAKPDVLLALSGGIDSAYLLSRLIANGHKVHCFWMDLSQMQCEGFANPNVDSDNAQAELLAATRVIDWFNDNIAAVSYEPVVVGKITAPEGYPGGNGGGRFLPMMLTAADLAKGYSQFVYGRTLENTTRPGQQERGLWYRDWWKKNAPQGCDIRTPLVEDERGRPHALYDLPKPLIALTLSCNEPKMVNGGVAVCNECPKCVMTRDAKEMLARGVNPDVIFSFQLKMRNAGPYIGYRLGDKRYGAPQRKGV